MYKNKKIPNLFVKSLKIKRFIKIKLSIDEGHNFVEMKKLFKKTTMPTKIS